MVFNSKFLLGDIEMWALHDGSMYFDGGAMFHIIPKSIWEQKLAGDENNRVAVSLNSLYFVHRGKNILIEAGAGTKYSLKERSIFKRDTTAHLLEALHLLKVDKDEIDLVLLSHLHRDHTGELTSFGLNKELQVNFSKARHIVHSDEWNFANAGNELSTVSYNSDDFLPIHQKGLFDFFQGESCEPIQGVKIQKTGAHSMGHTAIIIENKGQFLIFPSDIIPTRHHITLHWTCSYDYHSYMVVEEKRKLLQLAVERDALLYLVHEKDFPFGKIVVDSSGKYCWQAHGIKNLCMSPLDTV